MGSKKRYPERTGLFYMGYSGSLFSGSRFGDDDIKVGKAKALTKTVSNPVYEQCLKHFTVKDESLDGHQLKFRCTTPTAQKHGIWVEVSVRIGTDYRYRTKVDGQIYRHRPRLFVENNEGTFNLSGICEAIRETLALRIQRTHHREQLQKKWSKGESELRKLNREFGDNLSDDFFLTLNKSGEVRLVITGTDNVRAVLEQGWDKPC